MPQFRVVQIAGMALLLLTGGVACATDDHARATVTTAEPLATKAKPAVKRKSTQKKPVKKPAKRVIALPAEFVGLFSVRGSNVRTFAGLPVDTAFAADAPAVWHIPSRLLPAPTGRQPDTIELDLSETRVAVWLTDDLNLQCDLEQDPAIRRGDQFAVKVGLQFRFR